MPECPSCGSVNREGADHCTHCGQALLDVSSGDGARPTNTSAASTDSSDFAPVAEPVNASLTPTVAGNQGETDADQATLTIASEADKGKVFVLTGDEFKLGQGDRCSISLPLDKFASECHARVFRQGNDWFVEDNGSLNGTYVRTRGKVKLDESTEILIGTTRLCFRHQTNT